MKKRILTLFALAVVTVGAWADPYITIQKKDGFAATNMTPLEVTGDNPDPDARATYAVDLGAGSHTFWIVGHYGDGEATDTKTNTITFTLAGPQTITFYATHPKGKDYVLVVCNALNYAVGDDGWVMYTNLKASYGATTESYFASNKDSNKYKRFVVTGYQAEQPDYLISGKNSDLGILTQGTTPTKDRINKAELTYLTGIINYTAVEDVPVKISAAGVSTLLLPVDATIPSGVKAYTLKYDGSEQLKGTEVEGTIPANTPVLLNAAPDTYYFHVGDTKITYATPSASSNGQKTILKDIAATSDNVLTGTLIPHCVPENSYVLQNGANGVGFYKVTDTSTYKIDNFRCYIPSSAIPAGARSLSIVFDDSETTGIADVRGQKEDVRGDIFNLSGQRVGKDYKGVVIKNGRKMIQK